MSNALEPNQLEPTPRVRGITVFPGSHPNVGEGILRPLSQLKSSRSDGDKSTHLIGDMGSS